MRHVSCEMSAVNTCRLHDVTPVKRIKAGSGLKRWCKLQLQDVIRDILSNLTLEI